MKVLMSKAAINSIPPGNTRKGKHNSKVLHQTQEVCPGSHPLPSTSLLPRAYALLFIGKLHTFWTLSRRRAHTRVAVWGFTSRELAWSTPKILVLITNTTKQKQKSYGSLEATYVTFCCHDLYQVSSGLLAITWRPRGVIRLHSPVTVTESRLSLDPRLNTQALVYSQHGNSKISIPPFPQRPCWQLHYWGAHTWGVSQTGVAQTGQHLPYLFQPKGLQCPSRSFTVFPF